MRNFLCFEPHSLGEALACLKEHGPDAWKLAGGTDLLVRMKKKETRPRALVNLKRIPDLAFVALEGGSLRLGALTTVARLLRSTEVRQYFPALYQAARVMASPQIRELATVGGNICNASPAADLVPPLVAAGAAVRLVGEDGVRVVPLEELFRGPREADVAPTEILTEIMLPLPAPGSQAVYLKHGLRRAHELALVGVAVFLSFDADRRAREVRIALGAAGPTVLRARAAEAYLLERPLTDQTLVEAGRLAAEAARPIDDVRSSAWYRREMVRVLTTRALKSCVTGGEG